MAPAVKNSLPAVVEARLGLEKGTNGSEIVDIALANVYKRRVAKLPTL
jgi:hypothetical protein